MPDRGVGADHDRERSQQAHIHLPALWHLTRRLTEKEVAEKLSKTVAQSLVDQFQREARQNYPTGLRLLPSKEEKKKHK